MSPPLTGDGSATRARPRRARLPVPHNSSGRKGLFEGADDASPLAALKGQLEGLPRAPEAGRGRISTSRGRAGPTKGPDVTIFLAFLFFCIVVGATLGGMWGQRIRSRRRERWPDS